MSPTEARRAYTSSPDLAGEREAVAQVTNRMIPGPGGELGVRVYRPEAAGALPALVYFHGGGWVLGSLDAVDAPLRAVCNRAACVVMSVAYRLAPEDPFPAAAEDALHATVWLAANAEELGVDPARIAVGGDSAGGNLAAVACLMARAGGGPPIAGQVLIYPVTDCDLETRSYREHASGYLLTKDSMEWFWESYAPSEDRRLDPLASPLRARDLSNLPPALIVTAEHDPLRDEGEAYGERLKAAGVATEVRCYSGMLHGFWRTSAIVDEAARAIDDIGAWLAGTFSSEV